MRRTLNGCRQHNSTVLICVGSILCACSALPPVANAFQPSGTRVIFVNTNVAGARDGSSWADAYNHLQEALDDVERTGNCLPQSPCEIWVAAGTYLPSRRTDPDDPTSATFKLMNNVGIYGGFAGWETQRRQRDIAVNQTILDGDLSQDDDPTLEPTSNCCIERPGEGGCDDPVCEQIVVDLLSSSPDCTQEWDYFCAGLARFYCCELCRPSYCDNSDPVVLAEDLDTTSILDGVTVRSSEGTGLRAEASSLTVRHSTFTDNAVRGVMSRLGDPTFENCTFIRNRGIGADVWNWDEPSLDPSFIDCAFVQNGTVGLIYGSSRTISGCRFIRNGHAGLRVRGSTAPHIHGCLFLESAQGMSSGGSPIIVDCRFFGNGDGITVGSGGAHVENAILINCVFSGNAGSDYGALRVGLASSTLLLNCTFMHNTGSLGGSLGAVGGVSAENSIFWNNVTDHDVGAGIWFFEYPPVVNYSVLQNWTPRPGTMGNVDLDPLFVDADGPDDIVGNDDDNLRLSMFSPVIDLGDPDPSLASYRDADGHVRILRGRIDMGAYEFGIGDYDGDRVRTLNDFAAWDACMTGPDEQPFQPGCEPFDFKAAPQDHIDLLDFAVFQRTGLDRLGARWAEPGGW